MKAIAIQQFGGPGVFEELDLPLPSLKPHEVRLEVKAASVNPIDYKIRRGDFGGLFPIVLGHDMAGIVIETGAAVSRLKAGDEVWAYLGGPCSNGSYAEMLQVPEQFVARKPKHLSFAEAAAVPVVGLTALESLRDKAHIGREDTVFVAGGTGGVGAIAIQLLQGMEVKKIVTTCGGQEGRTLLCDVLGIPGDCVIDYRDKTAEAVAFEAIGLNGDQFYRVALDFVGGAMKEACFKLVDFGGDIVSVVEEPPDFSVPIWHGRESPLFAKSASLHFELLGARGLFGGPKHWGTYFRDLEWLAEQFEDGRLQSAGIKTFSLLNAAEVTRAHELLETRQISGKLVLVR